MRRRAMCLAAAAAMLLGGCAVKRASLPLSVCAIDSTPITTTVPGLRARGLAEAQALGASEYEQKLGQALAEAYQARVGLSDPQGPHRPPLRQLILSGGGQWGSYGTGFLHGWARRHDAADRLPKFDSVTGVSTGALQATLAFLGRKPAAESGRTFPVALDFPAGWGKSDQRQYDVDDLVAGYGITRSDSLYRYKGEMGIIRHAAAGDLVPLRRRMEQIITRETLAAVAAEGPNKRMLNVAVVDWDTGQARSIDMVKLASQLRPDGANFEQVRNCYVSVLLAASSETLAMPPVLIRNVAPGAQGPDDGTLYYDAGVRFGVFSQQLNAARRARQYIRQQRGEDSSGIGSELYIIANNELRVEPIPDSKRQKYNALDLAGRGRGVLVNQVYLMSIERIFSAAKAGVPPDSVFFTYVTPDIVVECMARPEVKAQMDQLGEGRHFYPLLMECLRQKGEERGLAGDWEYPA